MSTGSEAPPFWWEKPDWRAWVLSPFSLAYGAVASWRMRKAPRQEVMAPVLCVGNLTVGGEGKTPVCIALAHEARRQNLKPGFLSRGFGGSFSAPHLVDLEHDTARHVGDEPLLLARHAPVVVTPDRLAGAMRLLQEGCNFIIMDDGFQSARIHMDYALIVVDARRGLGNGHVIPGGPMRAPLVEQLRFATAILTIGEGDGAARVVRRASRAGRPVAAAHIRPLEGHDLVGRRVAAFAGIGNPQKFYRTLEELGAEVVATRDFPDHHAFSHEDFADLEELAGEHGAELVTTEKDMVRLTSGTADAREFAAKLRVLPVEARFETNETPAAIIRETVNAARQRKLKQRGS